MTRFSQPGNTRLKTLASVLVAAAGLLFCGAAHMNVLEGYCAGDGCAVYQEVSLGGIPLYVLGMVLFYIILCSSIHEKTQALYRRISLIALFLDAPFLLWQMVFFPCSNCLIVALLLLINAALALSREVRPEARHLGSKLITALAVLVLVNGVSIIRQDIKPWSITSESNAGYLFFSPSCAPCREHISRMSDTNGRSAPQLVPVSLSDKDDHLIFAMAMAIEDGLPAAQALNVAQTGKYHSASLPQWLLLQLRLHWNKSVFSLSRGIGLPWFTVPRMVEAGPGTQPTSGLCIPSKTQCE